MLQICIWDELKTAYPISRVKRHLEVKIVILNVRYLGVNSGNKKIKKRYCFEKKWRLDLSQKNIHSKQKMMLFFGWKCLIFHYSTALLFSIALPCFWLHFHTLDCTSMLSTALPYPRLYFITLDCTSKLSTALPHSRLHFLSLDCTSLLSTALPQHSTALPY